MEELDSTRLLSLIVALTIFSDGIEGRNIINCRKYFHKHQKRSEEGYSFVQGYQVTPTDEEREKHCQVYSTTPPPLGPWEPPVSRGDGDLIPPYPHPATPLPGPVQKHPPRAYAVYPLVIDVAAGRMFSAARLQGVRRGLFHRLPVGAGDGGVSGSLLSKLTPAGSGQRWTDIRSLASLLREGGAKYTPPLVVMGTPVNLTALIARGKVEVSRGFSRPVVLAKQALAVPLPSGVFRWCSSRLGFFLRPAGRCRSAGGNESLENHKQNQNQVKT
ncbi:uncharacterized protein [Osmerus mordax]|uniref:uncharacterized protein n=1 Tax=Osmerus mordax TaxID=8014 RepID=UPI00350FA886